MKNIKTKSLFSIYAHANNNRVFSIIEAAGEVISVFKQLSEVDKIFIKPVHYSGKKETYLNLEEDTIEDIGHLILKSEWNEITQFEGNKNPTLHYSRGDKGFSFDAHFYVEDRISFYANIGIGYKLNGISISNFNLSNQYEYNWYYDILHKVVEIFNPFFATVKLNNTSSNIFYREMKIKYPIGWITYFSDDYDCNIPNDLKEVRYEFADKGKYLYTSDEDFLKDKDTYFAYREKLTRIINEIKNRVPEFNKE